MRAESILLDGNGHILLTSLWLLKEKDDDYKNLEYKAPELLNHQPYTFATDMWMLGCLLYEMSVGKPPFTGHSLSELNNHIITREPLFPKNFNPDLQNVIQILLKKDPRQRFNILEEIKVHPFFKNVDWAKIEKK